jgi:hypothetical protein
MRRDNGRGSSFEYVPAKSDFVKRQTERRLGRQFDGIFKDKYLQLSKLQEGDNRFRILPATWKPHDDFAYVVWVHKYMEGGSYVCPAKMNETRCPICEEAQQARRDKDTERASEYTASETMVCWVIDRKSREFEDRPQLYAMPPTLYKDICGVIYDTETGKATMIDHDRKGYDIRVKRTGTKLNTRYLPMLANSPTPISADRDSMAEIIAYITAHPVPKCLEIKSESYLDKIMSGTSGSRDPELDEDEEDDEDEDDAPKKRKKGAKAYGDDDEVEDDDEPAPKKKRPKLRAAEDEEEEDQDADDQEDDDDAPPPKRRKLRAADEDEDEDDAPAPKRKKKAAVADDDDDADEDDAPRPRRKLRAAPADEDEDDEDEPAPKRKKLKARAEPEEEDEEADDQTDDDEDEDDAPPPKRRGRAEGRRAAR